MPRKLIPIVAGLALLFSACSDAGDSAVDLSGQLAPIDTSSALVLLAESDRPVVLNVWASWCVPCRSEAALLRSAHANSGSDVRFVGIAVRDNRAEALAFIDEFGLGEFEHYFDATGAVPGALGGFGVPLTFFFDAGGELAALHSGIIDERTLALGIDELLQRHG